jgi:predicted GNAT family acetyltransferase
LTPAVAEETGDVRVSDVPERSRFEARIGADLVGFSAYERRGNVVVFTHTEVDDAHEGEGVGGELARAALDDVRRRGLRVIARCPFVAAWIQRHPDYADLLAHRPAD